MDVDDAKAALKFVAAKESTRAEKRKAEQAREHAENEQLGAARAAKKAKIAARQVKTKRVVHKTGRVEVFY